ncbi:MAG: TauD/TfdA family dioxygenase [Novosphingobium sp.]
MSALDIRPLQEGRAFGARVRGITREQTLDSGVRQAINALFEEKGMIVFEEVEPSGQMHVAVSNIFGPLKDHPSAAVPRVDQDGMVGVIDMTCKPNPPGRISIGGREITQWLPWHFDHAYNNELNRAGVLRALEIPPTDGRTGFVDGIELYRALSPELRERIDGKNILYRMNVIMRNFHFGAPDDYVVLSESDAANAVMDEAAGVPRALHPAVWTRASGEKVLHVSPWMAEGIEGDETPEGDALLDAICREIFAHGRRLSYFHEWKLTDMLIWDNWRVLHAVTGHDPRHGRRMQRTTIKGDYGLGRFEGGVACDNAILERTY